MKFDLARLRALVTRNFWLKVLSLMLACLLWYVVYDSVREVELVARVPVTFGSVPDGLEIGDDPPPVTVVTVWLTGPKRTVGDLAEQDLSLHYDLSGMGAGVAKFEVDVHDLGVPDSARMIRASPGVFLLSLEEASQ